MLAMAAYPRQHAPHAPLTEREQKLLLKTTGEHRDGVRDNPLCDREQKPLFMTRRVAVVFCR